jgi:hypothetical protein
MHSSSSWMALQPLWALASLQFPDLSYSQTAGFLEWVISSSQGLYREMADNFAWGSLTCSKFITRVKQLKVPPGGLVPWIFPSLKFRRPPPGLNPRHWNHEVGTLPLDYGGRYRFVTLSKITSKQSFYICLTHCKAIECKNIKQKKNWRQQERK